MNTIIKATTVLFAALTINSASEAPKGAKLRLDLPVGTTVQMETDMQMDYYTDSKLSNKMMSQHIVLNNQYKVLEKNDGIHTLTYSIDRMRLDQSMGGQEMSFDSDNPESDNPMAMALAQQFGGVTDAEITVKVNELGEVIEKGDVSNPTYAQMLNTDQLFVEFPEKEITQGEKWMEEMDTDANGKNIAMKVEYNVKELTKDKVTLGMKIDPNSIMIDGEPNEDFKLNQEGSIVFDRKTGQMLNTSMSQVMEMENPQAGGKLFMVNNVTIKSKS